MHQESHPPGQARPAMWSGAPDTLLILAAVALLLALVVAFVAPGRFTDVVPAGPESKQVSVRLASFETVGGPRAVPLFAERGELGLVNLPFEGLVAGDKWGSAVGLVAFLLVLGAVLTLRYSLTQRRERLAAPPAAEESPPPQLDNQVATSTAAADSTMGRTGCIGHVVTRAGGLYDLDGLQAARHDGSERRVTRPRRWSGRATQRREHQVSGERPGARVRTGRRGEWLRISPNM